MIRLIQGTNRCQLQSTAPAASYDYSALKKAFGTPQQFFATLNQNRHRFDIAFVTPERVEGDYYALTFHTLLADHGENVHAPAYVISNLVQSKPEEEENILEFARLNFPRIFPMILKEVKHDMDALRGVSHFVCTHDDTISANTPKLGRSAISMRDPRAVRLMERIMTEKNNNISMLDLRRRDSVDVLVVEFWGTDVVDACIGQLDSDYEVTKPKDSQESLVIRLSPTGRAKRMEAAIAGVMKELEAAGLHQLGESLKFFEIALADDELEKNVIDRLGKAGFSAHPDSHGYASKLGLTVKKHIVPKENVLEGLGNFDANGCQEFSVKRDEIERSLAKVTGHYVFDFIPLDLATNGSAKIRVWRDEKAQSENDKRQTIEALARMERKGFEFSGKRTFPIMADTDRVKELVLAELRRRGLSFTFMHYSEATPGMSRRDLPLGAIGNITVTNP